MSSRQFHRRRILVPFARAVELEGVEATEHSRAGIVQSLAMSGLFYALLQPERMIENNSAGSIAAHALRM